MATARRNTRQRQIVLEELRKVKTHPTAAELFDIVRQRLPRISLGTVYRNLELLADEGLIKKLENSGGRARFDGDLDRHLHVRCVMCGRVDDIPGETARLDSERLAAPDGYELLGYRVEMTGICPVCAAREPEKEIDRVRQNQQRNL